MSFDAGEWVLVDHSLKVRFQRPIGDGDAEVELRGGTRVVPMASLSRQE